MIISRASYKDDSLKTKADDYNNCELISIIPLQKPSRY